MKKIVFLGMLFSLIAFGASAQKADNNFRDHRPGYKTGQLTRAEKFKLHKNDRKYKKTERKFKKDGKVTRMEKRKLYQMKRHDRHQTFRYKHNRHRRS